jgi:hypothetical protein
MSPAEVQRVQTLIRVRDGGTWSSLGTGRYFSAATAKLDSFDASDCFGEPE